MNDLNIIKRGIIAVAYMHGGYLVGGAARAKIAQQEAESGCCGGKGRSGGITVNDIDLAIPEEFIGEMVDVIRAHRDACAFKTTLVRDTGGERFSVLQLDDLPSAEELQFVRNIGVRAGTSPTFDIFVSPKAVHEVWSRSESFESTMMGVKVRVLNPTQEQIAEAYQVAPKVNRIDLLKQITDVATLARLSGDISLPAYDRVSEGFGDTVANAIQRLGIGKKKCRACKERQKLLNRLLPYRGVRRKFSAA